jgi:hypothetical protein
MPQHVNGSGERMNAAHIGVRVIRKNRSANRF